VELQSERGAMARQTSPPEPQEGAGDAKRRRRDQRLVLASLPTHALPGSLSRTTRRCGKPNCHCAEGEGHEGWTLTFMENGKKRVESVPKEWVDEVRRRVGQGQRLKQALADYLNANAEMLVLARKQRRR